MEFPEPSNKNCILALVAVSTMIFSMYLKNPQLQKKASNTIDGARKTVEMYFSPKQKQPQPNTDFVVYDTIPNKKEI